MSKMQREGFGLVVIFALLHLLCCGLPLLLLSGISIGFLAPRWPFLGGAVAVIGLIGFIWYLKRGCATCPRNEGRCRHGSCESTEPGAADLLAGPAGSTDQPEGERR